MMEMGYLKKTPLSTMCHEKHYPGMKSLSWKLLYLPVPRCAVNRDYACGMIKIINSGLYESQM
jgi:hypothetical protein